MLDVCAAREIELPDIAQVLTYIVIRIHVITPIRVIYTRSGLQRRDALVVVGTVTAVDPWLLLPQGCGQGLRRHSEKRVERRYSKRRLLDLVADEDAAINLVAAVG